MLLFSIIIPVYNAERFIEETIKSVLNQTYKNYELIIINDGSTDSSHEICDYYSNKCDNIIYIKKENTGVSDTRNLGINIANGEYLLFLDADDLLPNNVLEIYNKNIFRKKYNVIFGNHSHLFEDKILQRKSRINSGIYNYNQLKTKLLDDGTLTGILFGSVCGACYKKETITKRGILFNKNVAVNEDGLFNIKLLFNLSDILVIDDCLYLYRQWKVEKSTKLQRDYRFDKCNQEINSFLESKNELNFYNTQLKCRKVSVVFWNALRIKNTNVNFLKTRKYILELFREPYLNESLKYLDYSNMNIYKKFMSKLIKYRCVSLFIFIIKVLYPLMNKIVKI